MSVSVTRLSLIVASLGMTMWREFDKDAITFAFKDRKVTISVKDLLSVKDMKAYLAEACEELQADTGINEIQRGTPLVPCDWCGGLRNRNTQPCEACGGLLTR